MSYYISDHISWEEATSSQTAEEKEIENQPQPMHIKNMKRLAQRVFEPLRDWVGGAIKVTSFYRTEELCQAIGSHVKSQHCRGQAMDIDDTFKHKTNAEMFRYIYDELDYDQLIWEYGDDQNPDWIHISYVSPSQNRNQTLRAYKDKKGTTTYDFYEPTQEEQEEI